MLLLLLGCADEKPAAADHAAEGCWSLRTEDALPSMTQTYDVAARGDRVVATGLGLPYLSVIEGGVRTDAIRYAERSTMYPRVALDGEGTAWIASRTAPGLVRVDGDGATPFEVDEARWVVGLDAGVLIPRTDPPGVLRVSTDITALDLPAARGAAVHPDGVVVLGDSEARVLDSALTEVDHCPLPFAASYVVALDDRTLVVADEARIARGPCDGPFTTWSAGVEITDLVTDGATAWALDRIGAADPSAGVAWRIDADGPVEAFRTGKNSGYGEIADGRLWVNAEGTAEVHAYGLADGAREAAISTGTFVDGLVVVDGALVATGRLSGLLARFDGETLTRAEPLRWPWAPIAHDGAVWMIGQLDGVLAAVDPATLATTSHLELGPNALLTFGGLAVAEDRGTLLFAESAADVLIEVADGVEVGRWALGGPPVDDPDFGAQLEVLYRDGTAWLTRLYDGRLQRLDLETGARLDIPLDPDLLRDLQDRRRTRALTWDGRGPRLGPYGLDPDTLAVVDALDDVGALLAPWPGGGWLAVDASGTALLQLDEGGATIGARALFDEREPGVVAALTEDGRMAWVNRSYEGVVCRVALTDFGG